MTVSLGYTIFYVDDVEATLQFFTDGFGLIRRFITPEGDYGELDTGATALAFASTELISSTLDSAGGITPLTPSRPASMSITLITEDVAGTVDMAVAAGARSYVGAQEKPWGQTVAYVLDPNGILIEIATAVAS